VSAHKCHFHRKDASDAEKFLNDNNQIFCDLGVSAVNLFLYAIRIRPDD